jgi:hypothetical protein
MNLFKKEVTGDVQDKMNEVVKTQEKLYKSLSKLIGDVVADYNLIGNISGSDEESARLATNYIQVMASSKEYADKLMEANIELAAAIDDLKREQRRQNNKFDEIIKLLSTKKD